MSALYLVKDGDRTVVLAAERDGKLYGYVPNVEAFVYNKPMSVDFLIDQNMTYEPQTAEQAADIIKAGVVGKINGRTNKFLLDHMKAEPNRMTPAEVLGANALADPDEASPADIAHARAAVLQKTPVGTWIVYKTYPVGTKRQVALQLASHLRQGRIRAFRDIALQSKVVASAAGHQVVKVARVAGAKKKPIKTSSSSGIRHAALRAQKSKRQK